MLISLSKISQLRVIDKVIIHSLDNSLYQASIEVDGKEYFVSDNKDVLLRTFNIIHLQEHFRGKNYKLMVLRHQSAYDEMIGQPSSAGNVLEVPLKDNLLS